MADTDPNIIIDVSGNTAEMATDYNTSGSGLTGVHIPLSKVVWGDSLNTYRATQTEPLPIAIYGASGPVEVDGYINGTGGFYVLNYNLGSTLDFQYIAVAGSTNGVTPVGISGWIQGISGGRPVEVTGGISISQVVNIQGYTGPTAGGDSSEDLGIPVVVTGGRRLSNLEDSVEVTGSVNISGGRYLSAGTDSIKSYGWDGDKYVYSKLFTGDGTTVGSSGDAINVNVVGAGISADVTISSTIGVTNGSESPLKIQGFTAGSGYNPVIIRGENSGAVEITATSALNTSVSNEVSIDDTDILTALESSSKPIVSNLADIKTAAENITGIRNDLISGKVRTKITEIEQPGNVYAGKKSIDSMAQAISTSTKLKSGVHIKAHPDNSSYIMVGSSKLISNPDNGYLLESGESIFIECSNLNKIYAKSDDPTTQTICFIGS
jgi:hypothetical protein